ncbi:MAG TPA: flagellar hook basal-body protein [Chloroflexota bacterium]|nr:flagellar hook basal-body protein [Chloroflexota bacterium]
MIRALYAAASSMLSTFTRQEQTANNLANLNTPGFKRDTMPVRSSPVVGEVRPFDGLLNLPYPTRQVRAAVGVVGTGVLNDPVVTDFSDGDVRPTGNELDLALLGPGFFEMQAADGSLFYARAGEFGRDAAGRLVDGEGNLVLGDDGPVQVGQGQVQIDAGGTVYVDGEPAAILRVMAFPPDTPMRKLGNSGFVPVDPGLRPSFAEPATVVQQGALEQSNVDPTRAVIEMLSATRQYEAAQRLVQMNDAILERTVTDVGRV